VCLLRQDEKEEENINGKPNSDSSRISSSSNFSPNTWKGSNMHNKLQRKALSSPWNKSAHCLQSPIKILHILNLV
jgi:hypothetical protein